MSLLTLAIESTTTAPAESPINLTNVTLSLATALISALVATLMTHALNRKRAKDEWVRQRVFDALAELNDAHRNLTSEASPLYYSQPLHRKTLNEWRENVDMRHIETTVQYSREYNMALERLRMLIPGNHDQRKMLESLRTSVQTYFMTCVAPLEKTTAGDEVVGLQDIMAPIHETFKDMENKRTEFMQSLSKRYWNIDVTTSKQQRWRRLFSK